MCMVQKTKANAKPLVGLTGFQRDLLAAVCAVEEEPSGQAVLDELEKQYERVNHGRLYPNLDELVERGLVERGVIDRRTNRYETTPEGRRALRRNAHHQLNSL